MVQILYVEVRGSGLSGVVAKDNIWFYNCGNKGYIARFYQEDCDQKADQLALLWVWLASTQL